MLVMGRNGDTLMWIPHEGPYYGSIGNPTALRETIESTTPPENPFLPTLVKYIAGPKGDCDITLKAATLPNILSF